MPKYLCQNILPREGQLWNSDIYNPIKNTPNCNAILYTYIYIFYVNCKKNRCMHNKFRIMVTLVLTE